MERVSLVAMEILGQVSGGKGTWDNLVSLWGGFQLPVLAALSAPGVLLLNFCWAGRFS